jgi:hypothetical protein
MHIRIHLRVHGFLYQGSMKMAGIKGDEFNRLLAPPRYGG